MNTLNRQAFFSRVSLIGCFLIFCSGFLMAQNLRSTKQLFVEEEVVLFPELEGDWQSDDNDILKFQRRGENFYLMTLVGYDSSSVECAVTHWGDNYYLNLLPVNEKVGYLNEASFLPLSVIFMIDYQDGTLRLYEFDSHYENEKLPALTYRKDSNGLLITSGFDEWKELLRSVSKSAFEEPYPLKKIRKSANKEDNSDYQGHRSNKKLKKINAIPQFNYADGWLGGDGTLSVQLSDDRVLWIFSDSYVSMDSNAKTRKSSDTMIANCIAITNYQYQGEETHYYWNKMDEMHRPFFDSFTRRYKYWPIWAFQRHDSVFVFMHKVGPKENPEPNDLFSFSIIGTSLAVITNIESEDPHKWNVDLVSYSSLFPNESWTQGGTDEKYLYVFKNFDRANFLTRIPLGALLYSEEKIEYYSVDNSWKNGADGTDRKILFKEQANGSLEYYPDLKKWMFIYGPNFLSNEIKYRTSTNIEGPWSEAQTLYATPEQTLGNPSYDKRYFCYLARAHGPFYNKAKKEIVVTYDCNSVEFSQVSSSDSIYIPRVLVVKMPGLK